MKRESSFDHERRSQEPLLEDSPSPERTWEHSGGARGRTCYWTVLHLGILYLFIGALSILLIFNHGRPPQHFDPSIKLYCETSPNHIRNLELISESSRGERRAVHCHRL